ncbi:MAG: aryl-sulfate sulfotransferase [candidate division KSB1 bacterium]|nr:aryl-sulfate sulfotransferase [candidate division KSB1 bacterium]MDZ7367180.1 aryl-sulfate sulfotransferase [candidate division KSB1 bacterium]MDZ7405337.1 aryl-sulfate sulfotransferase [candidate division KSB1 bacterium]
MGAFIFTACSHDSPVDPNGSAILPTFTKLSANGNVYNVLSAIVSVHTRDAAAVSVEFGDDSLFKRHTPVVPVNGDSARLPVLGLETNRSYAMRVVAISRTGHQAKSTPFSFNTQKLPDDLPRLSVLSSRSPADDFVLLGFTGSEFANKFYALILDNSGRVVWYRRFPSAIADFQKQANGRYTVFSSDDGSPLHFYELDVLGSITRKFRAVNGSDTGPHELRLLDDSYCLFGIQFHEMNLSALGGAQNARNRCTVVEYHRGSAQALLWNPLEHFQVTDAAPHVSVSALNINPWHGNAIEIDRDGNLLVSFRNSDEITKINSRTGEIIWRLRGKKNQFTFVNDPLRGFSHQHGIRRLQNGNVILFDNGNLHSPPESRAVEL